MPHTSCACAASPHFASQVKENETEEERRIRLEMEALQADEKERREQVGLLGKPGLDSQLLHSFLARH